MTADEFLEAGLTRILAEAEGYTPETHENFDENLGLFGIHLHLGHVVHKITGIVKDTLPLSVGIFTGIFTGNPQAGLMAYQALAGSRAAADAARAQAQGISVSQEQMQQMQAGYAYLASQGVDVTGSDGEAESLMALIRAQGIDIQSPQAKTLISQYIEKKKAEKAHRTMLYVGAGGLLAVAVVAMAMKRR